MEGNTSKGAVKKESSRKFNFSWLDLDIFKGWLAPHSDNNKAFCTACQITITCHKSCLIKHSKSDKHVEKITQSLSNITNNNTCNSSLSPKDKIKRAEIKLSAFFAEHNISFQLLDHLIPLLKDINLEPEHMQSLCLGRKKCQQIVKHVIAKRETEELTKILQTHRFSILLDESTDIADTKLLCLLVKYVSPTDKKIKTKLFELISLDAKDCTASKLFETFKILFETKKIPLKNIVGMACDNASVMTGANNSFFSRLKTEAPGLILLNCICHSSAIIASKACEQLPKSCEHLIRAVATYMSGSAKRCAILGEFQDFFNVQRQKILKLSTTRWLVLHKCVVRLLDNWEVLKHYFMVAVLEDKSQSAETILTYLNDNTIKAYILFLKYSLNFFNSFNALFQSRELLIHKLFVNCQTLVSQIAVNFITPETLDNISSLNLDDDTNIQNVYLGSDCEKFLETECVDVAQEIRVRCLQFYKTALKEMLKRFPTKDTFFEYLSFLEPKIALYNESRFKVRDLSHIAARFEGVNFLNLDFEWTILPSRFSNEEKIQLASLEVDQMWKQILDRKDFNGQKLFPALELLIEIIFSLPHSNAEAERIFSMVTDIKTKKRNRLLNDAVSAMCTIRSNFQAENINCVTFQVDPTHLKLHNSQNLYFYDKKTRDSA